MHSCISVKESAMFTKCLAVAFAAMVVAACGTTEIPVTREVLTCDDAIRLSAQFTKDIRAEYQYHDQLSATEEAEIYNRGRGIAYSIAFLFPDCEEVALEAE